MTTATAARVATWRVTTVGDACEVQLGKMLSPKSKTGLRPRPYLRNVNVQWGRFDLSEIAEMDFTFAEEAKFSLRSGDLLVCEGGEPGRAAVWNGEMSPCFYQKALHRLRPKDGVDPKFVMYRLWLAGIRSEFLDSQFKTTIAHLPAVRLRQLPLQLPGIDEQRRIVCDLDEGFLSINRARAAAGAQLEAAQALGSSYLRHIFNSERAARWPKKSLGDVGEIVSGITLGRKLGDEETRAAPYLRVANVKDGHLDLSDIKTIAATEAEIQRLQLRVGDLLLTEGGDPDKLGRGTFWNGELPLCVHQNHIFRVRFNLADFVPEFLSAQMASPYGKGYFLTHAKQTTGIATINQRVLAGFPLLAPAKREQEEIVRSLRCDLDNVAIVTVELEEQFRTIKGLPAALLRRAFTGEL